MTKFTINTQNAVPDGKNSEAYVKPSPENAAAAAEKSQVMKLRALGGLLVLLSMFLIFLGISGGPLFGMSAAVTVILAVCSPLLMCLGASLLGDAKDIVPALPSSTSAPKTPIKANHFSRSASPKPEPEPVLPSTIELQALKKQTSRRFTAAE